MNECPYIFVAPKSMEYFDEWIYWSIKILIYIEISKYLLSVCSAVYLNALQCTLYSCAVQFSKLQHSAVLTVAKEGKFWLNTNRMSSVTDTADLSCESKFISRFSINYFGSFYFICAMKLYCAKLVNDKTPTKAFGMSLDSLSTLLYFVWKQWVFFFSCVTPNLLNLTKMWHLNAKMLGKWPDLIGGRVWMSYRKSIAWR